MNNKELNSKDLPGSPRILVVDDEAHLRELLEITLIKMGLDVDSAETLAVARNYLSKSSYALILTDMRLPDGSGMELVQDVNSHYKNTPIAVITAFGSADNAVVALKAGAFDYVSKPVALDQLRKLVRSALQLGEIRTAHDIQDGNDSKQAERILPSGLIGRSEALQHVRSQISRLARSMAPVIITGESGSGKELAAREIHNNSARADKSFIAVNCGAIPEALMEAEFFGYRKGAFTGASDDRDGFFQAASGGTLMLDEVADLPLAMQVKLLRAIQERRVRKVGATNEEPVDVRIISATHQNLANCVTAGKFRQDLYYRLNVIELHLPPLRERLEDVAELAQGILRRLSTPELSNSGAATLLSDEALQALAAYDFPGNVRELENILERALAFANDGCIEVSDLALRPATKALPVLSPAMTSLPDTPETSTPAEVLNPSHAIETSSAALSRDQNAHHVEPVVSVTDSGKNIFIEPDLPCSLPDYLERIEKEVIRRALVKTRNNRTQAAELLGVSFRQLRYQIQKLKIHDPE
ncbi:sigma-54 dependent transcriptional regulator [Undibacterium sp. RTI2.1]|uniref:sigma-54-dependent transcriptional regulator n=1 Tax=unclassified Undibacterium TaxID=2630295 RepID=UPI002AB3668A|nr:MULTISPECIES: sigma-54 dependent transcriptional regulator [unclassified Undibacterium]MDY7540583.1 sigma-54 dependent transcriptional regulator [Undibacterium sp. 5I1]MEB0029753.1 sigma-54 dependent transcriptional regulator [Undibacterium sp. RTI2.1]MEB0118139.1 sigma-54 dependent transcriptional regulator [Undibacterium sp. RTI2.2]MEB0231246.1 sigma-54 dependent transcriptional regulator [Undibacterium sp. 10I3]MEB0256549.1 sigma-54 dependent transcriptional regulator [Undibacterium sp. 